MTKIIVNKDLDLKILCKTLFKVMGFVTHYEIIVRNKSYVTTYKTHDISDVDVFGYRFNADLSYTTIGSECKSGESGAIDELFKFLGILQYFNIDSGYLIKSKIHQNAREVAIKNNFRCFTEAEIRKVLLGFDLDIDKQLRIENGKYYRMQRSIKKLKEKNEKLIDYIFLEYWNKENWKNIHNFMHLLQIQDSQHVLFENGVLKLEDKYCYYYILELLSRCVLKNVSEAMVLNYADIDGAIISCLYGGAESLNEKRRIHDLLNQATQGTNAFEPSWHTDLVTISSRFSQSTKAASKIPDLLQDIYENSFYESGIKFEPKIFKKYSDLTRKFTQDLIQFVEKHCKIENAVFEDFMKL